MKLTDIKIELFTRTTLTDYGVRFEYCDKEQYNKLLSSGVKRITPAEFIITVHILKEDGSINIQHIRNNHLTAQQLDEIQRISQILRMEK